MKVWDDLCEATEAHSTKTSYVNGSPEFSVVEPITARDKTGNALTNRAAYDFSSAFAVHPLDGRVVAQEPLSHSSAAVIIVTLKVSSSFPRGPYINDVGNIFAPFTQPK